MPAPVWAAPGALQNSLHNSAFRAATLSFSFSCLCRDFGRKNRINRVGCLLYHRRQLRHTGGQTVNLAMKKQQNPADLSDDQRWLAITAKDVNFDGSFVFGVSSTGILPPFLSGASPQTRPGKLLRLSQAAEAERFRSCLRCHPRQAIVDPQIEMVRSACHLIDERRVDGPVNLNTLKSIPSM